MNESFDNVWEAIADTPEEAENMKLRSQLMVALRVHLKQSGASQKEAAKLFGVTQPRISDLNRGKIALFSLDTLVTMASRAGLQIEMRLLEKCQLNKRKQIESSFARIDQKLGKVLKKLERSVATENLG